MFRAGKGRHDDGMGALRSSVLVLVSGLLVVGCSADPKRPAPAPSAPSPSPSAGMVQAVVDLKAPEAYGLTVDATSVWAIAFRAGAMTKVDPATNAVTQSVPLPHAASALATGDAIWVAGYGGGPADSALYRVDPTAGRVVATIDAGEVCCDLSAGDGGVWVVDPRGAVQRVDTATNKVSQRFDVTLDRNAHINAVYAAGSVWVSSDTTALTRIDARTGARTTIDVGGGVPFLVRDGLVWGASPSRLWAIQASTGTLARTVDLADSTEVLSLEVGFDAIWVGIRRPGRVGAVLKLDANTGQVRAETRDIRIPARMAIGFGSLWVTDSASSSLYRLSPKA
jgi:streptogramin lyase